MGNEEKLVAIWLDYMARGFEPKECPEGHAAWVALSELTSSDPVRAWALIKKLVAQSDNLGLDLLGDIAAGPFEDLLHGAPGSLEDFFTKNDMKYIDLLLPNSIYGLLPEEKKTWLDSKRAIIKKQS